MQELMLAVTKRDVVGKAVKRLREEGLVPAVIHDHGKPSIHIAGKYLEMAKIYQAAGKHHPVQLEVDGEQFITLIKAADFDPKKHELRHLVFNAIKADEKVNAEIPVHIKFDEGNDASPAERAGLVVLHQLEAVEIEALPRDLPDALYFDGEKLAEVGDHATVADLVVPAGVTIKTDPAHPLASVFEPSALQAANDAAGGDAADDATEADAGEAADGASAAGDAPAAEDKKA